MQKTTAKGQRLETGTGMLCHSRLYGVCVAGILHVIAKMSVNTRVQSRLSVSAAAP